MDSQTHWDRVYHSRAASEVSWFQLHLEKSLELIEMMAPDREAQIIDVGGGESTLVDDLLHRGYRNLTVLDVSSTAVDVTRHRLGEQADAVTWIVGDITQVALPERRYDIWHDRAVFHFLTNDTDRQRYVNLAARSVRRNGHVIVATFGPKGPVQCSGLPVVRYDADALHGEFGARFRLLGHIDELHHTPAGRTQQFLYCYCQLEGD
jgi:ubiquinone/menaquinone biosynthesis C-methylase UbiE